jgi:hypothetical protein
MIRILALLLLLALGSTNTGVAQETGPLVRYGKWVLGAGAVAMNLLAARSHDKAEDAYGAIEDACFAEPRLCAVGPDGEYVVPQIENLYQESLRYDRHSRRWLIGGETALLGAAALFVYEMTRKTHKPDNIPFEPEVRHLRHGTGIGVRVGW